MAERLVPRWQAGKAPRACLCMAVQLPVCKGRVAHLWEPLMLLQGGGSLPRAQSGDFPEPLQYRWQIAGFTDQLMFTLFLAFHRSTVVKGFKTWVAALCLKMHASSCPVLMRNQSAQNHDRSSPFNSLTSLSISDYLNCQPFCSRVESPI